MPQSGCPIRVRREGTRPAPAARAAEGGAFPVVEFRPRSLASLEALTFEASSQPPLVVDTIACPAGEVAARPLKRGGPEVQG